jgi:hypothetical protein
MQLSQSNYLQNRDRIDWSRVPAVLTDKPKAVVDGAAAKGWAGMGEQTQKATEQFFKLCNLLIAKDSALVKSEVDAEPAPKAKQPVVVPAKAKRPPSNKPRPAESGGSKLIIDLPRSIPSPTEVPVIATHTAFIKRYLAMHGKVKTRDQVVSLVHGLQKAITEQRIRKDNPALREIQKMQSELVSLITKMDDRAKIEIGEPYLTHYRQIAEGEEVRTSVKLLKQFIQLNGKSPDKAKAEKLGKKLAAAYDSIPKEDIYRDELSAGAKAIAAFVNGTTKTVEIPEATLHGLSGVAGIGSLSDLGNTGSTNPIVALLQNAEVKNLSDISMRRAFARTPAPGLCLELAKLMVRRGQLSMDTLYAQPSKKKFVSASGKGLAGIADDDTSSGFRGVDGLDILEMQLNRSGQPKVINGPQNTRASAAPAIRTKDRNLQPVPKTVPTSDTISAKDLAKMRFETIGYNGQFKEVIGDPATGFRMMVFGKPFQGKSSFVIELCKELARLNRGKVAYLCLEEGISMSMQKKVIDRGADKVEGLDFKGTMPRSFDGYGFVVIDSVSDRGISREQLREMFLYNPDVCFICIFHATKTGDARGGLDFSHDMDIIIRIDAHQPYVEKNRFL